MRTAASRGRARLFPALHFAGRLPKLQRADGPAAHAYRRRLIILRVKFLDKTKVAKAVMGKKTIKKHTASLQGEIRLSASARG